MNPLEYVKRDSYQLYIGGRFVPSESGQTFGIVNPATGSEIARAFQGAPEDAEKAIRAAREAFDRGPWGQAPSGERSRLLLRVADILASRLEELACLETLDCGKLYPSVLGFEALNAVDALRFHAGKTRCLEGRVLPVDGGGRTLNYVLRQPRGVIAEILPWNGPLMMGYQKISAILAAGNTVVVKPSSWAALSLLTLAEVFHEAGFPPGVVNVVTGAGPEVGETLARSPLVDMVSLTGGTETGKRVLAACADTVKEVVLELGGKSPVVVFDDVEVDEAAAWATFAFTLNSGQVCVAGTRALVHERIYGEFLERVAERCRRFVAGDGFDTDGGVNFGTLICRDHAESVWEHIRRGVREGARLVCGGVPYTAAHLQEGSFVPPTVFADVTPDMALFREEIFGPVLSVTPFQTEEQAIALANGTAYGLAGAVFSRDVSRAHRVAERLQAGQVYVNSYYSKGMVESPGEGWKHSGLGPAGIEKYMRSKTVFVELADAAGLPMQ
jgi:acyl-CoA reductase-like NAD-dependent aldehyde dehydrogenase